MQVELALKALGPEGRARLQELRPDLGHPPPSSLRDLARRAVHPVSMSLAVRDFDTPTMQVVEVLAALGDGASRQQLERLLGIPSAPTGAAPRAVVDHALEVLRRYLFLQPSEEPALLAEVAVAWPRPLGLEGRLATLLPQVTAEVIRRALIALGVPTRATRKADLIAELTRALTDRAVVGRALAGADPAIRAEIENAAFGAPLETLASLYAPRAHHRGRQSASGWAAERCLAFRTWEGMIMPADVALTVRGEGWHVEFDHAEPAALWAPRAVELLRREVGAAAGHAVRVVTGLLEQCRRRPVPRIKSGAIGVRELRRLGKQLGAEPADVRLGLALGVELALVVAGPDAVALGPEGDAWLRRSPAQQAAALATAWLRLADLPTLAADEPWLPLTNDRIGDVRGGTLGTLLGHAGEACDPQSLTSLLRWRFPLIFSARVSAVRRLVRADGRTVAYDPEPGPAPDPWDDDPDEPADPDDTGAGDDPAEQLLLVTTTLAEAAWVGVVADGALTPVGEACIRADAAALEAELEAVLGGATTTARLQADLTAVVLGHPAAELTSTLDGFADRETRSVASTWRFTPESVCSALDAGWAADDVLAQLTLIADGEVPQPLTYLVRDVERRHGHLRGGDAGCYLRGADAALLREVAADRRLAALGLRLVGEGVLIGVRPLEETLAALRRAGYAPVAEGPDGERVLTRSR